MYSGTAISAITHATSSTSGYNYELSEHQLKHAKVVYIGGFVGGVPVTPPAEDNDNYGEKSEGGYKPELPFVTPGLLKLIVKK